MKEVNDTLRPIVLEIMNKMLKAYWGPLCKYVQSNPSLITTCPGFLLKPEKLIIYFSRSHIGLEYIGPEIINEIPVNQIIKTEVQDFTYCECNILEKIIGFDYDSTVPLKFELPPMNLDLLLPTHKGWEKLIELKWNIEAQNSLMAFNAPCPSINTDRFTRIINSFFFDSDERGLITRHIKWLDLIPLTYIDIDDDTDSMSFSLTPYADLVEHDANFCYPIPKDYKYSKLPVLNRFIELWGNSTTSEPQITSFLAEDKHRFILTMRFGAVEIFPQLICEWQSNDKQALQPDFFVLNSNGYADIVEFKLPNIKTAIVGTENREAFSSWLNSYIAQTRVYSTYFDDSANRKWFESKYGFKVHKPRRWLIVGRRSNFEHDEWREIAADYRDLDILTFDDLVDGVVAQFYK
ncbi:MAG: DUF4263 domain-containing protein [Clostridiaceae bacterium]|nr:DUF4263 domain-containing protein [Clostridiaceae bacterium]